MRKIISIFMTVFMLISVFNVVAEPETEEVMIDLLPLEDYNDYSGSDVADTGWDVMQDTAKVRGEKGNVNFGLDESDVLLQFYRGNGNAIIRKSFDPVVIDNAVGIDSDDFKIVWEIDTTMRPAAATANSRRNSTFSLTKSDDINDVVSGFRIMVGRDQNSAIEMMDGNGSFTNVYTANTAGEFDNIIHNIRLEILIKEGGEYVNKAQLYSGDLPLGERADLESSPYGEAGIGNITIALPTSASVFTYVDNVHVYSVHTQEIVYGDKTELIEAVDIAIMMLDNAVEGMRAGQYLTHIVKAFSDAVEAAISVIEDTKASQLTVDKALLDLSDAVEAFIPNDRDLPQGGLLTFTDFEDSDISPWTSGLIVSDDAPGIGKALKITTNGAKIAFPKTRTHDPEGMEPAIDIEGPNVTVAVQCDLKLDSLLAGQDIELCLVPDDVLYSAQRTPLSTMQIKNVDGKAEVHLNVSGTFEKIYDNMTIGLWHSVRVEVLAVGGSGTLRHVNVYINGEQVASRKSFSSTNRDKIYTLGQFETKKADSSTPIYIDNFTVYKTNQWHLESLANKEMLIHALRIVDNQLKNAVVGSGKDEYHPDNIQRFRSRFEESLSLYLIGELDEDGIREEASSLLSYFEGLVPNGETILIAGEIGFYKQDGITPISSLKESDEVVIKIPVKGNRRENLENVAMIVSLVQKNPNLLAGQTVQLKTSGKKSIAFNAQEVLEAVVDLSEYDENERNDMYLRVMVWEDFILSRTLYEAQNYFLN